MENLNTHMVGKVTYGRAWLPVTDEQREGEWRDYYDKQLTNFTLPWVKNEPNGGRTENCVFVKFHSFRWYDTGCGDDYPCLCERDPTRSLRLRGLCQSSTIDKYYQPRNNFSNFAELQLVGSSRSSIEYDKDEGKWNLSTAFSSVKGASQAAHHTCVLGRHNWTISGDSG